jgi:hypothetical protein
MGYLGNTPENQAFTPRVDYFSGNASATAFTLSFPVASVAQVQAVIENVPQNPGDAFTVSGNTITFTSAPPSGTNNIYVYYTSPITQVIQPGQGTVGTAQIQSGVTVNFSDGSAAAPSITNLDDTNTGIFFPAADTIAFAEGGAEVARFDSSGNLLVGITSNGQNAKLNVQGGYAYFQESGSAAELYIRSGYNTTDAAIQVVSNDPLLFVTNNSERMRINAGAPILCLAGGSTSATGTGIAFPASQSASSDANTLDDYEEGLWTPVINGGYTTSRNISAGTYVKVGSLVYVHCQLDLTTSNSGSGAFFISGLPFTSFNTNNHGQALALGALFNWNINNSAYQIGARVNDSSASIYFWNNIDASPDDLLVAPFGNGVTVYGSISGCYRAAS